MLHARADAGLTSRTHGAASVGVWQLLGHSASEDVLTESFAWVIAACCNPRTETFVPALGLDHGAFTELLSARFPHFAPPLRWLDAQDRNVGTTGALSEFRDLLQLLLDHCAVCDEPHRSVAHLVATASIGNNHLWQDMGLPDRRALSHLLAMHFPALAAKNAGNMKWKKFFYRQLCEREGVLICKSPSCAACCDYANCFGPEA